jgi:S-disulfanyl-L-cysteine oxidoreductase SoxD
MKFRNRFLCSTVAAGIACSLVCFIPLLASAQSKGNTGRTVLDGVYTEAQAERGKAVYDRTCSGCHGESLMGGLGFPLRGDAFLNRWREDKLDAPFIHMKTMPMNEDLEPATPSTQLRDETYVDILAYILQVNTYPAGRAELTMDALDNIQLTGKNGPKPLLTNSTVKVVGCLTERPGGEWGLTNSSAPVRTRNLMETNAEELKASEAAPLTDQTFRLNNLDRVSNFRPDAQNRQKLQIKGVLIWDRDNDRTKDRINVTSLQIVSSICAP